MNRIMKHKTGGVPPPVYEKPRLITFDFKLPPVKGESDEDPHPPFPGDL